MSLSVYTVQHLINYCLTAFLSMVRFAILLFLNVFFCESNEFILLNVRVKLKCLSRQLYIVVRCIPFVCFSPMFASAGKFITDQSLFGDMFVHVHRIGVCHLLQDHSLVISTIILSPPMFIVSLHLNRMWLCEKKLNWCYEVIRIISCHEMIKFITRDFIVYITC